jgi:hypothetical protein
MRDAYLQLVHRASGVEERLLLEVLRGGRPGGASGLGEGGTSVGRISAKEVLASGEALPITEILRGVLPQEAELLRLLLLVPEVQLKVVDQLGPDQLPNTVARELYRSIVLAREPNDAGVRPPFSLTELVQSLDAETAALAQALIARRDPNPRALTEAELAYEIERLTIDLEERALDERSDYVQSALAEAEQAVRETSTSDPAARASAGELVDQLVRESQRLNDQRRSLHRRREQTRLLSRAGTPTPVGARA